jgi:co-chaperonin GroES (HSP10)
MDTNTPVNFLPTRDWVLLPHKNPQKTDSGIIMTEQSTVKANNILKVIAAGPNCELVKKGDTVMVHPTSEGLVIKLDEGEFVMVNEFMICGIIE